MTAQLPFPLCPLQILEYNTPGGKYNRGLTVLAAFRELVGPEQQDPESFQRALTVGWCIELVSVCSELGSTWRRRCSYWGSISVSRWDLGMQKPCNGALCKFML